MPLVLSVLCIVAWHSAAQNSSHSVNSDRILAPVDESDRVTLVGNVHPLARKQFVGSAHFENADGVSNFPTATAAAG